MKYSIIIASYNGALNTKECLVSIYKNCKSPEDFECMVIDDGSTDETKSMIQELQLKYTNLIYIRHAQNKGPIIRRNEGIQKAKGDFLLFLDNDTVFQGNVLSQLENKLATLPDAGIIGMCGIFIPDMAHSYHIHQSNIETDLSVQAVPSYCMMVSRELINKNIMFDERIHFMQHEDIDFCLQAQDKNYAVYAVPHIVLIHKEHGTFDYYKDTYDSDFENNWIYLMKKWQGSKIFSQTIQLPPLKIKESKKISGATFFDLLKRSDSDTQP